MDSTTTSYIEEDFLLQSDFARELYHTYVKDLPIIDYHSHLPPDQIVDNHRFDNISQAWLYGDHYKWRAMRTNGIDEKYVTGNASDYEKFQKWAETVPYTLRNPLYHWTHLELKRYFGINKLLIKNTAELIYKETKYQLSGDNHRVHNLLQKMNVEVVCTTDDPCDDLSIHKKYDTSSGKFEMYPTFRPDNILQVESDGYIPYLQKLEEVSNTSINSLRTLQDALVERIDYFDDNDCKLCDHGLSYMPYVESTEKEVNQIFTHLLAGNKISGRDVDKIKTAILLFLSREYHKRGWVQQFHLGALRNNNDRMLKKIGADTGWDSIGDFPQGVTMSKFFNCLDRTNQLTQTIIYNLNPRDNELFATMIGNYNDGSIAGKMQWGSAWWFLDQMDGMTKQINTLSNMGLISQFVGMLTDSRSFLSFPRHEYFRRLLCNIFASDIEAGLLPGDMKWIGKIVSDICYHNAKDYFNFKNRRTK